MWTEDWEKYSIGTCCDILDHKRIPVSSDNRAPKKGHVPYYGANGQQGTIHDFIFDEDLILIAEDGGNFDNYATRPIAYRISGKSWVNNHAHVLRAKNDFNQSIIFHSLAHKDIRFFIRGGTRAKLNKNELLQIQLFLPQSEKKQNAIATILDTLDNTIQQTQALVAKLKQVKAGMLHDLLTRGLDDNGELRDPLWHPEQFKESAVGRIPKIWEVRLLSQVSDIASGVTLGKNLQGSGTINLPYLRVANVQDGYVDLSDVKRVCINKKDLERYSLQKGDVLMNEGGDFDKLGRGAVWESQIEPCLHQNHVFRVRPLPNVLNSYFLDAVTGSQYGKQYFILISKQSTNLASINSTQLKNFPIPYPSLNEQESIATIISEQEKIIQEEMSVLEKLGNLKQALMQDLLTGKVRVPEKMMEAMP